MDIKCSYLDIINYKKNQQDRTEHVCMARVYICTRFKKISISHASEQGRRGSIANKARAGAEAVCSLVPDTHLNLMLILMQGQHRTGQDRAEQSRTEQDGAGLEDRRS